MSVTETSKLVALYKCATTNHSSFFSSGYETAGIGRRNWINLLGV